MTNSRAPLSQPKGAPVSAQNKATVTAQRLAAKLTAAVALHQQGRLAQAQLVYTEILQAQPRHFDALQLMATIALQQNNPAAALLLFEQALKINPDNAVVLSNQASTLLALKRPEDALKSCDRALKSQPDNTDALSNRGNALSALNRAAEALVSYDRALEIKPDHPETLSNRGATLRHLGLLSESLESYDRALQLKPNYPMALSNRGNTLRALGRPLEALASLERALLSQPDYADALSGCAAALMDLRRPEEALASCEQALQLKPDHPEALSNRGTALWAMNRNAEALVSYDRALKIKPDYLEALSNWGVALRTLGRPLEAIQIYERALQIKPDYAEVHWNEALCWLMLGEFELGWQKYEWRWKKESGLSAARNFPQPLWLGKEPLGGKTLLLHAEQGLGDTIQFCRYAKQVAALGARVVLEVQPALKSLLQGLEGVSLLLERGERLPDFDYHCPLMSLPLAFEADLSNISGATYLQSEPAKRQQWQARLGTSSKKRIGLVWSGSTGHKNDHNRSLSLQQLTPLIGDQAQYYCLQKELRPADQAALVNTPGIQFLGDSLKDFSDTAAVVELMDLVITVDTSVAHLAGAMGKEVWILLPYSPDWRWLLGRSDSPWYGSVRLFRQTAMGDWGGVLGQVQEALADRLK